MVGHSADPLRAVWQDQPREWLKPEQRRKSSPERYGAARSFLCLAYAIIYKDKSRRGAMAGGSRRRGTRPYGCRGNGEGKRVGEALLKRNGKPPIGRLAFPGKALLQRAP
jgi:hypothetical protein